MQQQRNCMLLRYTYTVLLFHSFHVSAEHVSAQSMAESTMPATAGHLKADDFASLLTSGDFLHGVTSMLQQVLGKSCNQLTEAERWVKQDAHMLQETQQQVHASCM
jgi:hypothetical protein